MFAVTRNLLKEARYATIPKHENLYDMTRNFETRILMCENTGTAKIYESR